MTAIRERVSDIGLRRLAHAAVALFAVAFFALQAWQVLAFVGASWFPGGLGILPEQLMKEAHHIHDFAFSLLFWTMVVGLLSQLRSPRKRAAGQLMALVPFGALLLAFALTDYWRPLPFIAIFGTLTLMATLLHPAGHDLVRSMSDPRGSRLLLALVVVAAVPLLAYAGTQVGLQTGAIEPTGHQHGGATHADVHEDHVEYGHYMLVAAFSFLVVGVGLLASLRPDGWWLPAWWAGILAGVFGAATLGFPDAASNAGTLWGVAAIAWGVAVVGATELERRSGVPAAYGGRREAPTPEK